MTDDIPDRLRTLAVLPTSSCDPSLDMHMFVNGALVCACGNDWRNKCREPTDDDRKRIRAHLDRRDATLCDCAHSRRGHFMPDADGIEACAICACCCFNAVASWRDFERDCACNPGPVPVEGGFVWRRCSCDETRAMVDCSYVLSRKDVAAMEGERPAVERTDINPEPYTGGGGFQL